MAFLSALFTISISGQEDCKVLQKNIAETYKGECKKGLAHGKGYAKGIDEYEGSFKKGYPDGEGTYKYSDGSVYIGSFKKGKREGYGTYTFKTNNEDTKLAGYWSSDKYIGKEKNYKSYKVIWKNNIINTSFTKSEDGNSIKIIIMKQGSKFNALYAVIQNPSGIQKKYGSEIVIEGVEFPFEGNIRFTMPNQMNSANLDCELTFFIEQPGSWILTIRN